MYSLLKQAIDLQSEINRLCKAKGNKNSPTQKQQQTVYRPSISAGVLYALGCADRLHYDPHEGTGAPPEKS